MKLKKTAALIAAILLAVSLLPAQAEEAPVNVVCSTVSAAPGSTVTVDISLENNSYVIHDINMDLYYDVNALTVESVTSGALVAQSGSSFPYYDFTANPGRVAMVVLMLTGGIASDGVIMSVTFKVADDCAADQPLTLVVKEFGNLPMGSSTPTPLPHVDVSGAIELEAPASHPGDVNCDGSVTASDISALFAYVMNAGSLSGQALVNADVNGDGLVDSTDASLLAQMVFGAK